MPRNPGTPADPQRSGQSARNDSPGLPGPGGPAPGEDRLVAGPGLSKTNDWFTRPSQEEIQGRSAPSSPSARGGRSRGQAAAQTPGPAAQAKPAQPAARTDQPEPHHPAPGREERSEGLVRVEFAGPPGPPDSYGPSGRSGRGGSRRRRSQEPRRSRGRAAAAAVAVVTASALAVGTGVALDRLVLPELRSEPASASGPSAQRAVPPAPGTDLGTRRPAGSPAPAVPTADGTPPPLKVMPNGTGGPSARPEPSASGTPDDATPGTGAASGTGSTVTETAVALLTNKERAKEGCAPLRIDARLVTAARRHSADMAANDYFDHTSRNGDSPWKRMEAAGYPSPGAENIAKGYGTAAAVVAGWMKSPGHRANILNCKLRAIGVGMASGSGGPWWTQDFGWK
ncbi:CAP domain-containing protein [Spirillospora sp. CA-255316]